MQSGQPSTHANISFLMEGQKNLIHIARSVLYLPMCAPAPDAWYAVKTVRLNAAGTTINDKYLFVEPMSL